MSVQVLRRQPTVPAWAWLSAALALLLLMTAVFWAMRQPPEMREVASRPTVTVAESAPPVAPVTPVPEQTVPYGGVSVQRKVVDWSESSKDFQPPPETNNDTEASQVQPKTIKIVVGKPAGTANTEARTDEAKSQEGIVEDQGAVPPAPRLRPQSDSPGKFLYGGMTWALSGDQTVSQEEADLRSVDSSVEGRALYALPGDEDQPSVLFLETSPGSGQYNVYRPVE